MNDSDCEPVPSSPPSTIPSSSSSSSDDGGEDDKSSSSEGDSDDDGVIVADTAAMPAISDGVLQAGVDTTLAMVSGDEASQSQHCQTETYGGQFAGMKAHIKTCKLKTCPMCKFWKFRFDWSDTASYKTASGSYTSWLAVGHHGGVMCLPCRDCIKGRDRFARGTAKFRLPGIMHHAKTSSHAHSIEAMNKKDRELDYGCEQIHRGQAQELKCSSASVVAQQDFSSIFCARACGDARSVFEL